MDSLLALNMSFMKKGQYADALQALRGAEEKCLLAFGKETALQALAAFHIGRTYQFMGEYADAETHYVRAKNIQEKTIGKNRQEYASSLLNLAILYENMGQFEQSEPHYAEALDITEKTVGKAHQDYVNCLNKMAFFYWRTGKYDRAEPLFLEAKSVGEKVLGPKDMNYVDIVENLAMLYATMGDYKKSEPLFLESKNIREEVLGHDHPDYAQSLFLLGNVYSGMGRYDEAETYYLDAMEIRGKTLGKDHLDYARSLNNLGLLYFDLGDYELAEQMHIEALSIREKKLGKEHPNYARSLINLARVYSLLGNYGKAEARYLEAKEIKAKTVGKEHQEYTLSLTNLAILYSEMGQFEKAEPLYLEGLAIMEKIFGADNPYLINTLDNLGFLYSDMGYPDKAENMHLRALKIEQTAHPDGHPEMAWTMDGLARVYLTKKDYGKAGEYYAGSLAIREKTLGKSHPDYAKSLAGQAAYFMETKEYEKAGPVFLAINEIEKSQLGKVVKYLSDREVAEYIAKYGQNLHRYFNFVQYQKEHAAFAYNDLLFYKNFLLNNAGQVKKLAQTTPEGSHIYGQLKTAYRLLAGEYALPLAEQSMLAEREEQTNQLEKELARAVAGLEDRFKTVTWKDVRESLQAGEAAIEFMAYLQDAPDAADSVLYAALLLRPDLPQPLFISLFEEKELTALLADDQGRRADRINGLYAQNGLYDLLWRPLEQELSGVKTLYFSPSGNLHRLNLNALPTPDSLTLADRHQLIRLNSTRQLAVPQENIFSENEALLLGGIEFDLDTTRLAAARPGPMETAVASTRGGLDFEDADPAQRGGRWGFLQWTAVEANSLQFILEESKTSAKVLAGAAATEENFKKIGMGAPSPRILHVATHGFFFPDPGGERGERMSGEPVFKISDHPMIRSGLILAGGNFAWENGRPYRPGMDDGILTAYEISQMDLSGTELVVLSACETGLGDIVGNEGVYGLQRAFKMAGAKNLLMSLWQVPDFQTQELMTAFYLEWLQAGKPVAEALRSAQKQMRGKYPDPFYWAGFVLVE